jgi:low temperature requirement protein LtrA
MAERAWAVPWPIRAESSPEERSREQNAPMGLLRARPVATERTHRVTAFEIFFDLVWVFALIRIDSFMAQPPTFALLVRGLVLLLLLWFPYQAYIWLGNIARADVGLVRAGMFISMAAIFVAAVVIPEAWQHANQTTDTALTLAVAYIVVLGVQVAHFYYISAGNQRQRRLVRPLAIPATLSWIPLIVGAMLGGTAQTVLWATVLLIHEGVGSRITSAFGGQLVRSPSHFAERFGLVLIIALGESLISVGAGVGTNVAHWPVLIAALLSLTATACLWWLYFENAASPAGRALANGSNAQRTQMANGAYVRGHTLLIAGIVYLALGLNRVLAHVAGNEPGTPTGAPLHWPSIVALYGGVVLYLAGRFVFLRLTVAHAPPAQVVAIVIALALLPAAPHLPALAALALLTAVLVGLVGYERLTWDPTAAAR